MIEKKVREKLATKEWRDAEWVTEEEVELMTDEEKQAILDWLTTSDLFEGDLDALTD